MLKPGKMHTPKEEGEAPILGVPQGEAKEKNATSIVKSRAKKRRKTPLQIAGFLCLVIFFIKLGFVMMIPSTLDTSAMATDALATHISTTIPTGAVLLTADEALAPQDYTIVHQESGNETKIWVWDYAAEDGDYVQIFVDGVPLGDAFMIKHKAQAFFVPTTGIVQIQGVRDGGGITYAIYYELNGVKYLNSAPEGGGNTYTLVRE